MRRVDTTAPRIVILAGATAIIMACCISYIPAVCGGFVWDDEVYVTNNPLLSSPDGLYRIWFSTDAPSQYFPLAYTSFWIEHKLWGFNPTGYHVVNVEIHTINALLLWLVLRRLSIPGAWFASAVFALHPVQVESVAWISERKNLLMLLFSLLSVLCWLEFSLGNRTARKAFFFYIGSLLLYALALFSKTTACTLPVTFVLLLWLKRSPFTLKRLLQIVPFVVTGIAMGLLVVWWENHHQGTGIVDLKLGLAGKLLIAGRALWFYLWKLFWPVNLTFSYPRWNIDCASIWQYVWPAAAATVLICFWFFREKLGRGTVSAALFFVATLLPVLSFLSLYTFVYSFVADHYQYAACIGPITLVSAGGAYTFRRLTGNQRIIAILAAGAILLTLGALTWRQSRIYLNSGTLWEDTLSKNPGSWLANALIGNIYLEMGKTDEATTYMERAIECASYMKTVQPLAYADIQNHLATVYES